MRSLLFSSALVAAIVLAGCSSSSSSGPAATTDSGTGTDGGGGVTADQACTDAIAALCTEVQTCSSFLFDLFYGDMPTCTTRLAAGCTDAFKSKGNSGTPDQLEACAKAVPSVACTDFLAGLNGTGLRNSLQGQSACAPIAGTLPNGSACSGDGQCQSAFCAVDKAAFCGTCATAPGVGDACITGACGTGLVCSTSSKCEKPGNGGDACTNSADCIATLECFKGKCTARGKAGDACDANLDRTKANAPDCDVTAGLGCKYDASFKPTTCQKLTESKAAGPCSFLDLSICTANSYCVGYDVTKTPTKPGTCTASADDGAACDPAKGPPCKVGAKCIGNVCKVSAPLTCN